MVHADLFTASSVSSGRTQWIKLAGEFDSVTAPLLGDELSAATGGDKNAVVLDLSALTFMDSAGARAVFELTDRVRAHGWLLRIVNPPPEVARVLTLIDELLEVPSLAPVLEFAQRDRSLAEAAGRHFPADATA